MRHLTGLTSTAILVLPLLLGTGARVAAEGGKPEGGKPDGKVIGPPEVAWKDMTPQQRGRFMKEVVTPKMKVTFQAYDPDLFADFGCKTCHGKGAKERKFKMPNPDLHALPGTPEAFMAALKKKPSWPKWTKFMSEKVEPQVGGLLGLPVFDPKKPVEGAFSCQGCHTLEGKDAPAAK